jgi:hypothetical protein
MLSLIRTDSKAEIQPMITAIRNYKGEIKILLCQHMREESRTKTSKWEELTRLRGVGSISKCEAEDYTPPTKTGLRSCTWICTWREMAIKIKFVLFGRTFKIIDEDSSQFFLSLIFLWVFEAYLVFFFFNLVYKHLLKHGSRELMLLYVCSKCQVDILKIQNKLWLSTS